MKVNVPLRQAALELEEELDMPDENILAKNTQHFQNSNMSKNRTKNPMLSKFPRTRSPNSNQARKTDSSGSTKKSKSRCSLNEEKTTSPSYVWTHVPGPQPIVMRCRKTLPQPPSGKLLEEIAELKEVLRRKHLSEVS